MESYVIKTKTVDNVILGPLINRKFAKTLSGDGIKLVSEKDARFSNPDEATDFANRQFYIPRDGWGWNTNTKMWEHQLFPCYVIVIEKV